MGEDIFIRYWFFLGIVLNVLYVLIRFFIKFYELVLWFLLLKMRKLRYRKLRKILIIWGVLGLGGIILFDFVVEEIIVCFVFLY